MVYIARKQSLKSGAYIKKYIAFFQKKMCKIYMYRKYNYAEKRANLTE